MTHRKQKGFTPIHILIGILVVVALGGAYYFSKSQPLKPQAQNQTVVSPRSTSAPTPDETANWKTYNANTKEGNQFSVKYPSKWVVLEEKNKSKSVGNKNYPSMSIYFTDKSIDSIDGLTNPVDVAGYAGISISITTSLDFKNIPLEDFLTGDTEMKKALVYRDVRVGGVSGKSVSHGLCNSGNCLDIYFRKVNSVYDVNVYNYADREEVQTVLNKILSTFKFIPKTPGPIVNDCFKACPNRKAISCDNECPQ